MNKFPEIKVINPQDSLQLLLPKFNFSVKLILMIVAGGLLPLGFAPLSYFLIAFLSFAIYTSVISTIDNRAFILGLAFGLAYFIVGTSWVSVSMNTFGNMSLPLSYLATFLFSFGMAIFPAAASWLAVKVKFKFKVSLVVFVLLVVPSSWMLFEWLRSWVLTGFPWLLLGSSQINSPIAGFMPLIGELGASWVVLFLSGLFILAIVGKKSQQMFSLLAIATLWLVAQAINQISWTYPLNSTLSIALVQGNTSLANKWNPDYKIKIIDTYYKESSKHTNIDLLVWPETAIPEIHDKITPKTRLVLKNLASNKSLISGIVYINDNKEYHNSLMLQESDSVSYYFKEHLVPFGEYTPLINGIVGWIMKSFHIPMSNLVKGHNTNKIMRVKNNSIAPSICYEVAFADLIRKSAVDADILLTVSNDTWFGDSWAPDQHLAIAQVRAKENGKPMVRVTNTGITAFIDQNGIVTKRLESNIVGSITADVQGFAGSTFYSKYGTLPFALFILVILLGFIYVDRRIS